MFSILCHPVRPVILAKPTQRPFLFILREDGVNQSVPRELSPTIIYSGNILDTGGIKIISYTLKQYKKFF